MSPFEFTTDWFSHNQEFWLRLKPLLPGRTRFLEIGSYEGRSMVWTVQNMMDPGGEIVCVDTWEGSAEHRREDMRAVERRFDANRRHVEATGDVAVWKEKATSADALRRLAPGGDLAWGGAFDFIYIDGSHVAKDVLTDACLAWPLLKPGGVLVFDDYLWPHAPSRLASPKAAIDAFIDLFDDEIELRLMGYQVAIQKVKGVTP